MLGFAPDAATTIKLRIAVVGKAKTAMELDGAVRGERESVAREGLGHADGDLSFAGVVERAGRVI